MPISAGWWRLVTPQAARMSLRRLRVLDDGEGEENISLACVDWAELVVLVVLRDVVEVRVTMLVMDMYLVIKVVSATPRLGIAVVGTVSRRVFALALGPQ